MKTRKTFAKKCTCLLLATIIFLSVVPVVSVNAAQVSYDVFTANTCTYKASNGDVKSVSQNSNWNSNLISSDNVSMQTAAGWWGTDGHWANANELTVNALYSTVSGGSAIFRIPSDENTTITTLIVNGRSCMNTAVSFSVSNAVDGTFTEVYTIASNQSGIDTEVDISAIASQWEQVYVKVSFPQTNCADWAALWNIRATGIILAENENVHCDVFSANSYTYNEASGNVENITANTNWNINLVDSNNVSLQTAAGWNGSEDHWANPNTSVNALYSTNSGGYAVFAVPVEEEVTITTLIINGRCCMGTSVSFAVSNTIDGVYTNVYTVGEAQSGRDNLVDVSEIAADWDQLYVKAVFPQTACADWAALWSIQAIGTEDPVDNVSTNTTVLHWNIGKEDQYDMSGQGVSRAIITTQTGDITKDYNVLVLGPGEHIDFTLPQAIGTETTLTLELREIHKHGDGEVDFTVSLNGDSLLNRVVTPVSEGPIHTLIDVNSFALSENNQITITNNGTQEVRLESIWFYEDLDSLLTEEDIYRPLEVVLFTMPLSYSNYEADLAVVESYKTNYSGYNKYTVGMGFDIYYMQWEDKVLFEKLDWLMNLSADSGLPLYLDLNSWWSATPHGMDGVGGFWNDLNYQQVIYDPDNVNGQGEWQLSTPNMWGSTPWLSMNNTWYNQIRNLRLQKVSDYISQKQAEFAAEETPVDVNIFMENEPTYWAYKHYNPTTVSGRADLSYYVIQDAAQEGVTLDPTDGLSSEEELWLFNNHTGYIKAEGNAVCNGLGNDPILLINGTTTFPETQMSEKLYSHVQTFKQTIDDTIYPSWEYHVVDNLRMGLEYAHPNEMTTAELQYVTAKGTYANVNIERSAIGNFDILSQLYTHGADHAILFNVRADDFPLVSAQDASLSEITGDVQQRTRNLWIACRADVERILGQIEGSVKTASALADYEAAKVAYANGRYKTAYTLLMKVQSTADLPIDFTVSGTNKLLDYPVIISSDVAVNVVLYSAGETLKLKLTSENAANVTITWEGVNTYTLTNLGDGVYQFTNGGTGSGAVTVKSAAYYEKDYPSSFEAVFVSEDDGYISIMSQDATICEYVDSVALKIANSCQITRAQDGYENTYQTVLLSDLQKYDLLELSLNNSDEVIAIHATYGAITGDVVNINYPVVNGTIGLSNPSITIRDDNNTLHTFEICSITNFNYLTKTGHNMQTSSLTNYGLPAGDRVTILYSPYATNNRSMKAISICEDSSCVPIYENFENGEFGTYLSIENVQIRELDSNYKNKVVAATNKNNLGTIIWEIQCENNQALDNISITYGARNILGTSVRFYISYNEGQSWEQIGSSSSDDWNAYQQINITNVGENSVRIKCELDSRGTADADTWACLDMIHIKLQES